SFFLVFCFFFFGFFTKTFHFSQYNIFKWFFTSKIISFFFKTGNEYSGTSTGFWWSPDETVFISGPKISKLYLSNESFSLSNKFRSSKMISLFKTMIYFGEKFFLANKKPMLLPFAKP